MSKKPKVSPTNYAPTLLDFPPEMIDFIGTFPSTGSTRRMLSTGNNYLNKALKDIPHSQRVQELKYTLLEYYYSKKFIKKREVYFEAFYVDVKDNLMKISRYTNPEKASSGYLVEIGIPILGERIITENDTYTPSTMRPIGDFPEIVRTVMAFVFHQYYTSIEPLPAILEINFIIFQGNALSAVRLMWNSFNTFIENNPYYILINALLDRYESLQYLEDLPIVLTPTCNVDYKEFYKNEIEPFYEKNNVEFYEGSNPQQENSLLITLRLERTNKKMEGSCYIDQDSNLIFKFNYELSEQDVDTGFIVNTSIIAKDLLKIVHILLPACDVAMEEQFSGSILVYLQVRFPGNFLDKIPYFFIIENKYSLCEESYQILYSPIENWIKNSLQILRNNLFYTLLIHDDLSTEVKDNYFHFESLPQYVNQ